MVNGELGRFPIDIAIKIKIIRYWGRLVTGKKEKYAYRMYKSLHKQYTGNNLLPHG